MLSEKDICIRVGLAFIAGLLVGLDRESHGRAAGLRTTILVCVAAALGMIFSEQLVLPGSTSSGMWRPDPGRLAAGMLTGMGFLGAGSIMRQDNVVRGVTTAAMLWYVTVLGLAFGAGHFTLGATGLGVALVVLIAMPLLEKRLKHDWYGHVSITTEMDQLTEAGVKHQLERMGVIVLDLDLDYDAQRKQRTMGFEIQVRPVDEFRLAEEVVRHFAKEPGVVQVKWS